ncbi:uncharacterized protein LOC125220842 [Salvia hispanica]|uniref:uncharacterized protein LOC125220842 n=1 Tax=Salvia hispanica TaxID=49212 RepID=UPI002009BB7A|nr:uncharacterized protein LOC125220842 [Salvia hispanica]
MASSRAGGSGGGASDSDSDSDSENELDVVVEGAIDRLLRQRQQRRPAAVPRPIHRRHHVPRDHIVAHIRLYRDYFAPQRFRMHRPLFMHIVSALERRYEYFGRRGGCGWQTRTNALTKCLCRNVERRHTEARPTCSTVPPHWRGKNCPAAWKRMHTSGFKAKHPTMILEATIKHPIGQKKSYFASRQEAARKDVERAFGVLQSRWAMVKGPSRMWYIPNIGDIMYACIILHNMIVKSEGDELTQWTNEDYTGAGPSHGVASANVNMGVPHGEVERLRAFADMRQRDAYIRLQEDIIEEVWTRRDGR